MRTCPTSASSPRPSDAWSSTSTTSTRPCPARGNGTSSGWRRGWGGRGGGDAKRPAASVEVAGRGSGFGDKQRRAIVLAAVARYPTEMRALAGLGEIDAWQLLAEVDELAERYQTILDRRERRLAGADLAMAR